MTATTQYQPGNRVTWYSRWTRKTYTGTVEGPFVADQVAVEQDPQAGDTHRATWHVPAADLRPFNGEQAAPRLLGHLPKAPHRPARKPGRHNSPTRRAFNLTALAARVNAGRVTVADYLAQLGADSDTIRRYSATLGKRVKAAYVAKFGAEPVRDGLAVVGHHLTKCFAYGEDDAEILRDAAISYPKTSRFVGV